MSITLKDVFNIQTENSNFTEARLAEQEVRDIRQYSQSRLPRLSKESQSATKEAAEAFNASEAKQKLDRNAPNMTLDEIRSIGQEIAKIPEIQRASELAKRPELFDANSIEDPSRIEDFFETYGPHCIVVNVGLNIDVVVGCSAFLGFAYDLEDMTNMTIYTGLTFSVGGDADIAAGTGVGYTGIRYNEMTGRCVGFTVADEEILGALLDVSIGITGSKPDLAFDLSQWTIVIYAMVGIGGGIDGYFGVTKAITTVEIPNIVQAPAKNGTIIRSITCLKREDQTDNDELYFKVIIDREDGDTEDEIEAKTYRYPLWDYFSINENGTWYPGFTVNFNKKFELVLYDSESTSDDRLCSFTVTPEDLPSVGQITELNYDNDPGAIGNHVQYRVDLFTAQRAE